MKEYKVVETRKKKAEALMNEMAAQGWEVVSMTYWTLLITFARTKQNASNPEY